MGSNSLGEGATWEFLSLTESINKRFVENFISHRVHGFNGGLFANVLRRSVFYLSQNSRMNRSLSANVLGRGMFYLSQIFTDEQRPFSEQGEPTNAGKQTTESTEHYC